MKTAISLPDDLFHAADRVAARLGLSRSELFRRALVSYLERHDERAVTEALDAVYAAHPSGLEPEMARMQAGSLPPDDW